MISLSFPHHLPFFFLPFLAQNGQRVPCRKLFGRTENVRSQMLWSNLTGVVEFVYVPLTVYSFPTRAAISETNSSCVFFLDIFPLLSLCIHMVYCAFWKIVKGNSGKSLKKMWEENSGVRKWRSFVLGFCGIF